jgi:hypothetical protein
MFCEKFVQNHYAHDGKPIRSVVGAGSLPSETDEGTVDR